MGSAEIIKMVEDALAGHPAVRAIFHNGSHVVGTAVPGSDVDFTILTTDEPAIESVRQRLAAIFTPRPSNHAIIFMSGEVRVCCAIFPKVDADATIAEAFTSVDALLACQGLLQHKFIEAVPVYDPDGLLPGYKQQLARYPDALACEIVDRALANLQQEYLVDWGFRNAFHYAYCLRDMLEQIGLALYALNKRFYMPPLKRWGKDISQMEPNITDELLQLIDIHVDSDWAMQREALAQIIGKLKTRHLEKGGG